MDKIIGMFDSGVGGLTTATKIREIIPEARIIYYNDHKNCPYGERSKAELLEITSGIVRALRDQGAKIIVIACNTATTQCIEELREKFPDLRFVGTEPAIKLACDAGCENILLLATPGTVKSERLHEVIAAQSTGQSITLFPCADLAKLVEDATVVSENEANFEMNPKIQSKLDALFAEMNTSDFDAVVLGCTHYVYLKEYVQQYFPKAKIFDGNLGVAERVKRIVTSERK